jgi:thiamine biosynthesis lipoprotein
VEAEVRRLEAVFSLYQPASALSQLNSSGHLAAPPPDLLEVLALSDRLHIATEGAFDPTVQPLFAALARAVIAGRAPGPDDLGTARGAVGWGAVIFDSTEIRLARPGAALTLNGIAQGYITDRIAGLLTGQGLSNVLVDIGEIAARGQRPGGGPWTAGVAAPEGALVHRLTLSDRALATSAPKGTLLDPAGRIGHILDPESGTEAVGASLIAVSAPSAAVADGLSTALCVMPSHRRPAAVASFPDARLELAL